MENGNCISHDDDIRSISKKQNETKKELEYSDYLKLEKLLSAQSMRSVEFNQPAHHEHLFIITHQAYELWFKQIIFELDSLRDMFKISKIDYENPHEIIKRLHRIVLIMKLLIEQINILETMTALDFLEFRDLLCPASGFQSWQFRLIENKLGLSKDDRVQYQKDFMNQYHTSSAAYHSLKQSETEPSLLSLVQQWLEDFPWRVTDSMNFEVSYKTGVQQFLKDERFNGSDCCPSNGIQSTRFKNKELLFNSLFDNNVHEQLIKQKERKLSRKAILGGIIILMYHNDPQFRAAYQIINLIVDVDLHLTKWRTNHMLMVQKMIGSQVIGTGGSSGYHYLRLTLNDQYKIFGDLANLPAYLIPRSYLPSLEPIKKIKTNSRDF
ncbi:tryptophan 2,3-dioxygenase [Planococcus citri]|uniref:tryptophan 2,3-dioxygenase n=1 Tax=Planococcus citri TaxID=170843 RepID=UPI0031F86A01